MATPASSLPTAPTEAWRAPCPAETLPDHGACIPVDLALDEDGDAPEIAQNAHHDRQGRLVRYEHIPRRPERAADYRRYALPIAIPRQQAFLGSGYDLDLPDAAQRRGSRMKAVGHGGLDLAAPRGAPVHGVRLEHQRGDAEVLYVGELFGTSVVTLHSVAEAGTLRDYLIVHGHLERANASLRKGDSVTPQTTLGFVGDTGSPGVVHLHFEVRRARDGVAVRELGPRELVHNAKTIACDPRNVLEPAP
ncbi:MAG: peptidoglycan DD-metalloendopeptidase family protein [Myxococcota bacterium]